MKPRRLLELWEPPEGFRLASALATTYELQADFLEEDLLPVALGLRLTPARGREFRLELEGALQDTEVSVFFHPDRYQRGLRRSPRVDFIPLPEGRYPKLHAKVALLRFVSSREPEPERQIVRLIAGSANLTSSGYRNNIEVCAAIDDGPGAAPEIAMAVRDAVRWLEGLLPKSTVQVGRQLRDLRAVFESREAEKISERLRFIGLPSAAGLPALAAPGERVAQVTLVSPFWPSGEDLSDVVLSLRSLCGGSWKSVRLLGPAQVDEEGVARPVIPAALVRALLADGARVEVAAADPGQGCGPAEEDEGELDALAGRSRARPEGQRALHAKAILVEGKTTVRLAMGSFNLTRKGLGLVKGGNAEAGLMWALPAREAGPLKDALPLGAGWREVTQAPEELVVEPAEIDGDEGSTWPVFVVSVRATREELWVEGDAASWPRATEVQIRMRDIRSRLQVRDEWFDPWVIQPPDGASGSFEVRCPLSAGWMEGLAGTTQRWPALPDLEVEVLWGGHSAVVPVVFEDKHLFPVVESWVGEDEQSLIAWFLGLRQSGDGDDLGFGHGIDPIRSPERAITPDSDILSYLVRDFVHALPGVHHRLAEGALTESGLRSALFGHRSPIELAGEALRSLREPRPGRPRKTAIATAFQLVELVGLLESVPLPELAGGVSEALRAQAIGAVRAMLAEVRKKIPRGELTPLVREYLESKGRPR